MFAAMKNRAHVVNELLLTGADLTLTNINGDTAVSLAVKCESKQAQQVMEQHLANYFRGLIDSKAKD